MLIDKQAFVMNDCIVLFENLKADAVGKWGVMNGQQVLEHIIKTIDISSGKVKMELVTSVEYLPKFKEFLYSDKEFRENTKAPGNIVGEEPEPCKYENMAVVFEKLSEALGNFVKHFKNHPESKTLHPVFGELNYEEWILIHYKHFTHHMKQFELI